MSYAADRRRALAVAEIYRPHGIFAKIWWHLKWRYVSWKYAGAPRLSERQKWEINHGPDRKLVDLRAELNLARCFREQAAQEIILPSREELLKQFANRTGDNTHG